MLPVSGGVMGLRQFHNMLFALINNSAELFNVKVELRADKTIENVRLKSISKHRSEKSTLPVCLDSSNNIVAVGDLITSVSIYSYIKDSLEEIAFHPHNLWTSAVHVVDENNILAAADDCLFSYILEQNKRIIEPNDAIYIGQHINKFVKGSLVMAQVKTKYAQQAELASQFPKSSQLMGLLPPKDIPTMIFATGNGIIGIIGLIPKNTFMYLNALEEAVADHVSCLGDISYKKLSTGKIKFPKLPGKQFINGDIVENLLKMDRKLAEEIHNGINYNPKPTFRDTLVLLRQLSLIH